MIRYAPMEVLEMAWKSPTMGLPDSISGFRIWIGNKYVVFLFKFSKKDAGWYTFCSFFTEKEWNGKPIQKYHTSSYKTSNFYFNRDYVRKKKNIVWKEVQSSRHKNRAGRVTETISRAYLAERKTAMCTYTFGIGIESLYYMVWYMSMSLAPIGTYLPTIARSHIHNCAISE